MKEIIPIKIMIDLKEDGSYKDAILIYKIKFENEISPKTYTISISSKISVPIISGLIADSKIFVDEIEKKKKVKVF
jgi:hypothetical protein